MRPSPQSLALAALIGVAAISSAAAQSNGYARPSAGLPAPAAGSAKPDGYTRPSAELPAPGGTAKPGGYDRPSAGLPLPGNSGKPTTGKPNPTGPIVPPNAGNDHRDGKPHGRGHKRWWKHLAWSVAPSSDLVCAKAYFDRRGKWRCKVWVAY